MSLITICIPVLNEEENILNTYNAIDEYFKINLKDFQYEIIFTDNNSSDKTQEIITNLAKGNQKIKYIRFNKNIGYDLSILEGYRNSSGEAAIVIDCDLQDPVNILKTFIDEWKNGHDLVYGVRKKRKENFLFTLLRKAYYKIMNESSQNKFPEGAGGFRLIDKTIINRILNNNNIYPYVRGLTFSLAARPKGVDYDRTNRKLGQSKLGYYNTFTYGINALIEQTRIFVRFFARIGIILLFFSVLFSLVNVYYNFEFFTLFQNIILLLLMLIVLMCIIISEYVMRIYLQIKKENKIIYEKKINLK